MVGRLGRRLKQDSPLRIHHADLPSSTHVDRHAHDTPLANPVTIPATGQTTTIVAKQSRESGGTGTDWNAVFAGAAGSALIIAMCAGGLSLVRRRTVAA